MKFYASMILTLVMSISAYAREEKPLLSYHATNGPVTPTHRRTYTCNIYSQTVTQIRSGANILAMPITKSVLWSKQVNNVEVLKRLVAEAREGEIIAIDNRPMGGGVSKYLAEPKASSPTTLLVKWGNMDVETNQSKAARVLVKFINHNCT